MLGDLMNEQVVFDLHDESGNKFYLIDDLLEPLKEELTDFFQDNNSMMNMEFVKKVLFSHELQANNQVEGYFDDIELINNIIKRKVRKIDDVEKKQRIINLYKGYQFILKYKLVNEKSLRKLYDILSKDLLIPEDIEMMGEYYRKDIVYIVNKYISLEKSDQGVDYHVIPKLMNEYFNFFNNKKASNVIDEYLYSQILHFYLVYIHPYFDVNGRCARTMSMWHLIKNEAYPFIIFNREIAMHSKEYYEAIENTKLSRDLTIFLLYMMKVAKVELEKEYLIQNIKPEIKKELKSEDYQTLLYFLSINGMTTTLDFTTLYNKYLGKKKPQEVNEKMLLPLVEKGIFNVLRYSNKKSVTNMVLELNKDNIDCDMTKIKRLKI